MKRGIIAAFLAAISYSISFAQVIPSSRVIDWSKAGNPDSAGLSGVLINVINAGVIGDAKTPCDSVIANILATPGEKTIYFPKGSYLFNRSLVIPSGTTIKGESADSTIIIFSLPDEENAVKISGEIDQLHFPLSVSVFKNTKRIYLDHAEHFPAGSYAYISDNDSNKITSSWAKNSTGQVVEIVESGIGYIEIESALRRDYLLNDSPFLQKIEPVRNTYLENFTLWQNSRSVSQTSNIAFSYAFDCGIKCINSLNANFAHVDVRYSDHISIEGSHFAKAFDYGDGGKGYGVCLEFATGQSLVTGNIFDSLRHSILLQAGANGNVIAYNYSRNPYWTEPKLPSNSAGDIVLHGNYPYANLFEGNVVQNIVVDNSHGANGPLNTFFRNRAQLYGIVVSDPLSSGFNFAGNEITNTNFLLGNFLVQGKDHYFFGNNIKGSIQPIGTTDIPEQSLFENSPPSFYKIISSWPPIGTPNVINTHQISAEYNFNHGWLTECSVTNEISDTTHTDTASTGILYFTTYNGIKISPNPARERISITVDGQAAEMVEILDELGKIYFVAKHMKDFNLSDFTPGIYFARIHLGNGEISVAKIVRY